LDACFFVGKRNDLPSRDWLIKLFAKHELEASERSHVLSGIAPSDAVDTGPVVCACLGVGRKAILEQIKQGADTPEKIGKCLNAGTNCGSCVPEIRDLIHDVVTPA
jgi:assimilatory nitrate reductase catalytic subunit